MANKNQMPRFRVTKTKPPRVFLQCSACSKDIKEIFPKEEVNVTRAYHCRECEPGNVVVLNPPMPRGKP